MEGTLALLGAFLAFVVPLAAPLFARRWRTWGAMLLVAAAFFAWLSHDLASGNSAVGSFLGGLMLIGFSFGAIAKAALLLGRPRS